MSATFGLFGPAAGGGGGTGRDAGGVLPGAHEASAPSFSGSFGTGSGAGTLLAGGGSPSLGFGLSGANGPASPGWTTGGGVTDVTFPSVRRISIRALGACV